MLDVIFIALWLINRSKAKKARAEGRVADAAVYAKRAKIFGWIEVCWLVVSVIIGILLVVGSDPSGY